MCTPLSQNTVNNWLQIKKSNLQRHLMTKHATFAAKYPCEAWKKACEELQRKMKAGQSKLLAWSNKGGSVNSASFVGSLEIVRKGKLFTDGEYVKSYMLNTDRAIS